MKKAIILLVVLCLLAGGALGYFSAREQRSGAPAVPAAPVSEPAQPAEPAESAEPADSAEPTEAAGEAEEPVKLYVPDYAAMYALHEPDEIVGKVGGHEVSWGEYYYLYFSQAKQIENYFNTMSMYYGAAPAWSDQVEEDSDRSFADIVKEGADSSLRQIRAVELLAEENGVELTAEQQEAIRAQEEQDIVGAVGEGATAEDFNAYIETIYLPRALYDRMNRVNHLYRQGFNTLYGENGEQVDEATALRYLEDGGYLSATHILLMTIDENFAALDEEATAARKAQAEEIAAQLRAVEDEQERLALFRELKEQYCEDTGKAAYPDGYTFLPGTMVTEFENAVLALAEYEISDPVLTDYGYHVIMRLPLNADSVIEYSEEGAPLTARSKAANEAYGAKLEESFNALTVEYAEGFRAPNLLEYLKEAA